MRLLPRGLQGCMEHTHETHERRLVYEPDQVQKKIKPRLQGRMILLALPKDRSKDQEWRS
jgi:hypothetical protein